jgi:hypothetical protein
MSHESRLDQAASRAQQRTSQRSARPIADRVADLGLVRHPSIVDFVLDGLQIPHLYPRQASLLKVVYLEALTEFDRRVLRRWGNGFTETVDPMGVRRFDGSYGTSPDLFDRIAECHALGRRWFAEVILVMGRRASKSLLAAICAARMIDELLLLIDPQDHFNIVPGKRLTIGVFAGQEDQARALLFRDIAELIARAPRYAPFVAARTAGRLLLYSPRQILQAPDRSPEDAVLEIVAREATVLSGRGPASPMLLFDEMAHMIAGGSNRSAAEVVGAATPALAQFREFSMLVEASSPGGKAGKFYENAQYALELDATGAPVSPTSVLFQLPSWAVYEDFECTHDPVFFTRDGGRPFPRIDAPLLTRNDPELQRRMAQDPRGFNNEFNAEWMTVENAFLDEDHVLRVFAPLASGPLTMRSAGALENVYYLHVDPARRGANFAAVIAHASHPNGPDQLPYLVIDLIRVWRPVDYPSGEIDQYAVVEELLDDIEAFRVSSVTVDQYDATLITQFLAQQLLARRVPWPTQAREVAATPARNRREAELFREAIALDLVHAPPHELAMQELLHLQEHAPGRVGPPASGLITTSDVSDCFFALAEQLLGEHLDRHRQIAELQLHAAMPGGVPQTPQEQLSSFGSRAPSFGELRGYHRPRFRPNTRPGPRGRAYG